MATQIKSNNKEESTDYKSLAFWIMIIVVIVSCIMLIYFVENQSVKCMAKPWSYAISNIKAPAYKPIYCSCTCSFLPSGESLLITPNETSIINSDNILEGGIR